MHGLDIQPPSRETLVSIVTAQLGAEAAEHSTAIIEAFLDRREHGDLATDQLLNAIYLATSGSRPVGETRDRLLSRLLRTLELGSLRMIERLLEILSASAEAPDAAELADALWLATHIPESSAQVTSGAGDGACAGRPGARSRFAGTPAERLRAASPQASVHLTEPERPEAPGLDGDGQATGILASAPAVPAIAGAAAIDAFPSARCACGWSQAAAPWWTRGRRPSDRSDRAMGPPADAPGIPSGASP